ncbi:MAG: SH3 domain-containing protein [Anaerolineae bacterium]
MKRYILLGFLSFLTVAIHAQEALCPTLQQAAIAESQIWCAELDSDQACYGNSGVTGEALSDLPFSTVGDTIPLTELTQLTTRTDDENRYGVAYLHTAGYPLNTWAAYPVHLVALGSTTLANTANEGVNLTTVTAPIIGADGANVRSGPGADYRLLNVLFEGDLIKLTGRAQDNSAYRVQLPSGETGWITSGAIEADTDELPIVEFNDTPPAWIEAPYSAFSLETGIDDAPCAEVWQSGVLLQTSTEQPVRVRVNDHRLVVIGTVFLQAESSRTLVHVIEGMVAYQNEQAREGYTLAIFEDDYNLAPYDLAEFVPLPTQLLPRYTYIGVELTTIITPAPTVDRSPIADVLVDDPCVITTGQGGANLRSGPGAEFPIRGVLAYRETARPISRVMTNGTLWYELAQNIWVNNQVIVTGGDCIGVPQAQRIPAPLPTPTNEAE